MGKIYKNQTALKIQLDTEIALADTTVKIKYKKPDKSVGQWVGTIVNSTVIEYEIVSQNDLDLAGVWWFWSHVTFPSGKSAPGEAISERIYTEGE